MRRLPRHRGPAPTHGEHDRTPEYRAWKNMIARCECQSTNSYPNYGARGIVVCERWRLSYEAFLADMGRRPTSGHSLDRVDNGGNYEPGNVRWATRREQARNTRRSLYLTHAGETASVADWSKRVGIKSWTIYWRLRLGWSAERALTEPVSYVPRRHAR